MQVSWSHCVLRVRDMDTMIDFYCATLGFELADRGGLGPDTEIAFLSGSPTDHHQLGLMSGRAPADDSPSGALDHGALDHNAFRVAELDDVKSVVAAVAADDRVGDGAAVTHGNAISVYFADPEGNGIEVFCDTPWHVPQPQIAGWDPTASNEEILAAVEARFASIDGVMPMEDYRAERERANS